MTKLLYVVAISQKEAEDIAEEAGFRTKAMASERLREVQAPPTDPYYAAQYRIYTVERESK